MFSEAHQAALHPAKGPAFGTMRPCVDGRDLQRTPPRSTARPRLRPWRPLRRSPSPTPVKGVVGAVPASGETAAVATVSRRNPPAPSSVPCVGLLPPPLSHSWPARLAGSSSLKTAPFRSRQSVVSTGSIPGSLRASHPLVRSDARGLRVACRPPAGGGMARNSRETLVSRPATRASRAQRRISGSWASVFTSRIRSACLDRPCLA